MVHDQQQLPGKLRFLNSSLTNSEQITSYGALLRSVQCKLHSVLCKFSAALCHALLLQPNLSHQLPGNTRLNAAIALIRQDWRFSGSRVAGCRVDTNGLHSVKGSPVLSSRSKHGQEVGLVLSLAKEDPGMIEVPVGRGIVFPNSPSYVRAHALELAQQEQARVVDTHQNPKPHHERVFDNPVCRSSKCEYEVIIGRRRLKSFRVRARSAFAWLGWP
jgi:hypothetical protein